MNRRTLVIIASIVVLLGLLALGWYLFMGRGATLSVGTPSDPFGSSGDRPLVELTPDGLPLQGAGTVIAPRLIRITDAAVAEGTVSLYIPPVPASSSTPAVPEDVEVRFIERQSGNVYAFRVHDRLLTRISNRTVPGIQDVAWSADGTIAFARYLARGADGVERVDTYALPATADGGEGYFLEQGVDQVLVQGSNAVFSLLPNAGGSVGTLAALDGSNPRTLFTSTLSRLIAGFSGTSIIATTKASSGLDGYSFLVEDAGTFTRLLGPLRGLSALPNPEGGSLLYSYADGNRMYLSVLDLASRRATALPLATLAEKCVWAPGGRALYCAVPTTLAGNLPDDWYQGARSFSDRLWRIDMETRLATLIVDPVQVGDAVIDAVALSTDPLADTLTFMNRIDGTLWVYDL